MGRDLVLPHERYGQGRHRAPRCFDDRTAIGENARIAVVVGKIATIGGNPVQCGERLLAADAILRGDDFGKFLAPALELECRQYLGRCILLGQRKHGADLDGPSHQPFRLDPRNHHELLAMQNGKVA